MEGKTQSTRTDSFHPPPPPLCGSRRSQLNSARRRFPPEDNHPLLGAAFRPISASAPSHHIVAALFISQRTLPPLALPSTFICHHQVLITSRSSDTPLFSILTAARTLLIPLWLLTPAQHYPPYRWRRGLHHRSASERKKKKGQNPPAPLLCNDRRAVLLNSDGGMIDDLRLSVQFKVSG